MSKTRFKIGQTVWTGRGDTMQSLVIARVVKNPLLPMRQYGFEAPYDGYLMGEHSLRTTANGRDLTLRECFHKEFDNDKKVRAVFNTVTMAKNRTIRMEEQGRGGEYFLDCDVFFRPDYDFVRWLINYADGRLILDVGSGQGHLLRMIKAEGGRVMGIEPNFDLMTYLQTMGPGHVNDVLPRTIQEAAGIVGRFPADKVLAVFARPSHSTPYVEEGIALLSEGVETLYITLPENVDFYSDLGRFKDRAVPLEFEGQSEDNEVVLSIIR